MSSNEIKLAADSRTEFGKGASRRLRREGKVPAVIYGHGTDPVHIALPGHESLLALRAANALLSITIDGGKAQLALPKQVQRDPLKGFLEHVDLLIVKKGETVEVEVPIVIVGEPFSGTNALQELNTLRLSVPATNIPEHVEVNIEGFEAGARVLAGEVKLASDETLLDAADQLVVHVVAPRGSKDDEAAEEAAE